MNTTPYEVVYGQPPPLHLPYMPNDSNVESIDRSFFVRENILKCLKENLHKEVNRMKQQADKCRSEKEFSVGDWVFLKLQPYRQGSVEKRRSEKLSPRFYGPYKVLAKVGLVAYKLRLLEGSKVHPTFHVSLLKKCHDPCLAPMHIRDDFAKVGNEKEPVSILDRKMARKDGNQSLKS